MMSSTITHTPFITSSSVADDHIDAVEGLALHTISVIQAFVDALREEFVGVALSSQEAARALATTITSGNNHPPKRRIYSRMIQQDEGDMLFQVQKLQTQQNSLFPSADTRNKNIDAELDNNKNNNENDGDERIQLIYRIVLPLLRCLTHCYEFLDRLPPQKMPPQASPREPRAKQQKKRQPPPPPPPKGMLSLQQYTDVACLLEFAVCTSILPHLQDHILMSLSDRVRYQLPKSLAGRIPRASLLWGSDWVQQQEHQDSHNRVLMLVDVATVVAQLVLLDRFRPMLLPRHLTDVYAAFFQAEQHLSESSSRNNNNNAIRDISLLYETLGLGQPSAEPTTSSRNVIAVDATLQAKAYQTLLLHGTKSPSWLRRRVSPFLTQLASRHLVAILMVFVPLQDPTLLSASCQRLGKALVDETSLQSAELQQQLFQQLMVLLTVSFPATTTQQQTHDVAPEILPRSMAVIQTAWAMIDHFPSAIVETNILQRWKQVWSGGDTKGEEKDATAIHGAVRQIGALCAYVPPHSNSSAIQRFLSQILDSVLFRTILRVANIPGVVRSSMSVDAEKALLCLTLATCSMEHLDKLLEVWVSAIAPTKWDMEGKKYVVEPSNASTKMDNLSVLRVEQNQSGTAMNFANAVSDATIRAAFFVDKILKALVPIDAGLEENEDDKFHALRELPSKVFQYLLQAYLADSTSTSSRITTSILLPLICEGFSQEQLLFGNQEDASSLLDLIHQVLSEVRGLKRGRDHPSNTSTQDDFLAELADLMQETRDESLSAIASLVLSLLIALVEMGSKQRSIGEENKFQILLPVLTHLSNPDDSYWLARDEAAALADMAAYAMTLIASRKANSLDDAERNLGEDATDSLTLQVKLQKILQEAETDLMSVHPPLRARGMVTLGRLARGFSGALPRERAPTIVKELDEAGNEADVRNSSLVVEMLKVSLAALSDSESYVYLAAIQTIVALCDLDPRAILPLIATGVVSSSLDFSDGKELSRIQLSTEQGLKLTEALVFAIRRRAVTHEYFPILTSILLGRNESNGSISSGASSILAVDEELIRKESNEYFATWPSVEELSPKERMGEQDMRLKTGGPVFDVEETDALRSVRVSVLAELTAASSPSTIAQYCHIFVPLAADALRFDKSRLVTRAASLLARELYSSLLQEADELERLFDEQDSVDRSNNVATIPMARALLSSNDDRLEDALKAYTKGVNVACAQDSTTFARCEESILLRAEAQARGIFAAAKMIDDELDSLAKLPSILRMGGAENTNPRRTIQLSPRDTLE